MSSPGKVMTGTHFMMGNLACAEGAIAAGCNFAAGYPITPASDIVNRLASRLPGQGGIFLQTEDEISAICSVVGASWAGCKALTATSGPGISLMQETIGFAVATETPLVIIDVQRVGPSTGVPSVGMAGDIVQVARGSHGDYQIIALCPSGPQEMFDHTVRAFNLAERYRVPVFVMADGFIGHMRERVFIPEAQKVPTVERRVQTKGGSVKERQDFLDVNVAPMPVFGRSLHAHVTSSCHDRHGMRNLSDPEVMHTFITAPIEKILKHADDIIDVEEDYEGKEVAVVSYGTVSRAARAAVELAAGEGLSIGTMRLVTCWPFPEKQIRRMAERVRHVIVMEDNCGQLFPYVKAEAAHACKVDFLPPQILGQIHDPEYVVKRIKEMIR
ncbi:2-oxoacid:acceptor oxidoreductase subunit alpha [Syntrophobacter fumaroxidans]|uniref:2-oxoglutarate ferredoxin oxidoreductase, alpha subunit n=1 Tax=Syntrophobacter fumaroxidans (strain DSM 10017 / MPOB) TaxID=335543 RepID=A0LN09_SYNFM|nr:2-oxoacid:acceptor oxidoreductase subunit alpha [Syntrophobacter fumaroxidans]ABK18811.1 2-oxoglutarate ferredoxin oxidoreductase, alpha subunit [Syntrophobacter fumaroxidans MPOB]